MSSCLNNLIVEMSGIALIHMVWNHHSQCIVKCFEQTVDSFPVCIATDKADADNLSSCAANARWYFNQMSVKAIDHEYTA